MRVYFVWRNISACTRNITISFYYLCNNYLDYFRIVSQYFHCKITTSPWMSPKHYNFFFSVVPAWHNTQMMNTWVHQDDLFERNGGVSIYFQAQLSPLSHMRLNGDGNPQMKWVCWCARSRTVVDCITLWLSLRWKEVLKFLGCQFQCQKNQFFVHWHQIA